MPPSQCPPQCSQTGLSVPQIVWVLFCLRDFDSVVTSFSEMFSQNFLLTGFFIASWFQQNAASSEMSSWNTPTKSTSLTSPDSHLSHLIAYFFRWLYFTANYLVCLCLLYVTIFFNFFSPCIECKLPEGGNKVCVVGCCIRSFGIVQTHGRCSISALSKKMNILFTYCSSLYALQKKKKLHGLERFVSIIFVYNAGFEGWWGGKICYTRTGRLWTDYWEWEYGLG